MKLFSTGKTGVFLESLDHRVEKRKSGETKVAVLGCAVRPLTVQLAAAVDEVIRGALFRRTGDAAPQPFVRALEFHLPIERQDVTVFASPDTVKPSILFQQVKIERLKARIDKDSTAYTLTFKAVFGPCAAKELAYLEDWLNTQRFLSFEMSEPDLDYEEGSPDADDEAVDPQPALAEARG